MDRYFFISAENMASRTVVIFGSNGALGRAISKRFSIASWNRVLCDVVDSPSSENYINLSSQKTTNEQYRLIESKLSELSIHPGSVNAIVNVGGGFRMDTVNVR